MNITWEILMMVVTLGINAIGLAVIWGQLMERVDNIKKRVDEEIQVNEHTFTHVTKLENDNQRLFVALWGIDGQNGLRGNLKDLSLKVDDLQDGVHSMKTDIRSMEDKLNQIHDLLEDR